ncbi:hypothetical protein [Haliovirga abyssi]|uniref:Uncharacterized protein n=1 Tax=Haliovirga abyssi TaxID=2996794 RepID=A0AAU9DEU8_9FUSO|nr:hypothetical protein [Haliovirga abyssi]BDU50897.1 hypothetical protein HLVA_14660 [Haliovirga abyssi]
MAKSSPQTNFFMKSLYLDRWYNKIFILIIFLSIIFIFLKLDILVNILSILFIIVLGVLKYLIDFYREKGEIIRRRDFIDNSFGSKLHYENSEGYYDNEEIEEGLYKTIVNLFENTFFSKEISEKMKQKVLYNSIIPGIIIIGFSVLGFANSQIALPILQLFLSKIFIMKTINVWNYNKNTEDIFNRIIMLFNELKIEEIGKYEPQILNLWIEYECSISNYKLFLDSKIYNELNPILIEKWNIMKEKYKIK